MSAKIGPNTNVCKAAVLTGDVTIGEGCIIHPTAHITAVDGPIIIGPNCIVEEQVRISNRADGAEDAGTPLVIGSHNLFEVGAICDALIVGDGNIFEAKSVVGRAVEVTECCRVGVACNVTRAEVIPEGTVVFGAGSRRIDQRALEGKGTPSPLLQSQLVHLRGILPKFHQMQS